MMDSRATSGGEHRRHHVTVASGGLPRPTRPVPGAAGPRPGTPRPGCPAAGGSWSPSGRVERPECNWWGAGARQQATTASAPRRPRSSRGAGGGAGARVPTGKGNRELVRRALAPPAARGRGRSGAVLVRRWSFRPAPSRLRNASSLSSHPQSPASPRPRPSSSSIVATEFFGSS